MEEPASLRNDSLLGISSCRTRRRRRVEGVLAQSIFGDVAALTDRALQVLALNWEAITPPTTKRKAIDATMTIDSFFLVDLGASSRPSACWCWMSQAFCGCCTTGGFPFNLTSTCFESLFFTQCAVIWAARFSYYVHLQWFAKRSTNKHVLTRSIWID